MKWEPTLNKPDNNIVQTRRKTGTLLRTRMLAKTEQSPMGEVELANIPHLVGIDPQVLCSVAGVIVCCMLLVHVHVFYYYCIYN